MPLPTSLGLHIEHYYGNSTYVIITRLYEDRCTMLDQSSNWGRGAYDANALSSYQYKLINPSITTLQLLKRHYPEVFI